MCALFLTKTSAAAPVFSTYGHKHSDYIQLHAPCLYCEPYVASESILQLFQHREGGTGSCGQDNEYGAATRKRCTYKRARGGGDTWLVRH